VATLTSPDYGRVARKIQELFESYPAAIAKFLATYRGLRHAREQSIVSPETNLRSTSDGSRTSSERDKP
jgi:hypothetical protein